MTCYHPIKAYKLTKEKTQNKKTVIVFKRPDKAYSYMSLSCGQCIGCRIARSKSWALRCVHEASLYSSNCFITLTYNDENLPENESLDKTHFQKFMKRLRESEKGIDCVEGKYSIRYFHCGEYGSKLLRPHHHACIFNYDFKDKKLWQIRDGVRLYRSETLEKLWPFGFCTIGEVSYQSAAYVARYCMKKITGKNSALHYARVDTSTGEIIPIQQEYITMSRRPGIARRWFEKYKSDVYPKDFITHQGKKFMPPKYYDKIYDIESPEKMSQIKLIRLTKLKKVADNNTTERLKVRETVLKQKAKKLIRSIEK